MFVYRCENEKMIGPYRTSSTVVADFLDEHDHDKLNHPTPTNDNFQSLPLSQDDWRCGFTSIRQMSNWFSEYERKELRKLGFRFLMLEAGPDVMIGGHQCVFKRGPAKIIEEILI